jgi:hypothetical protein
MLTGLPSGAASWHIRSNHRLCGQPNSYSRPQVEAEHFGDAAIAPLGRGERFATASIVSLRLADDCFDPAMHERGRWCRRQPPRYCFSTASVGPSIPRSERPARPSA